MLFLVLGVFAGFLGIVYNRTLLGTLAAADQFSKRPVEFRAAAIGAVVGMLVWFVPGSVGSGESLIQRTLIAGGTLATLLVLFILRLGLGSVSYAAGTPGGLMAPILALGAQFGQVSGILCRLAFPSLNIQPEAFTVVGMAALNRNHTHSTYCHCARH